MSRVYRFGPFRLDTGVGSLAAGDQPTPLGPRAVGLLAALLARANEYVTKADLLEAAWPGLVVEEANLSVQMSAIRRVLAAHGNDAVRIETLARRGYRFVGAVGVEERAAAAAAPAPFAVERDTFVGRVEELNQLTEHLRRGVQLVTLTGAGGSGKTRLARRFAAQAGWPGGTWFCDLSDASGRDGLHFAVATGLGVTLPPGDPTVLLGHAIAGRGRCLVVLDNFEQLVAHANETVGAWRDQAPDASFIVTSRERLHLPGEALLPVEPLPLATDAVELFSLRAQTHRRELRFDGDAVPVIADIVRLLDGLPLAIELAAARVRILSLPQLRERLGDRFRVLTGATHVAARQATLQAAIDWSWQLLAPWEQAALAACAVFEGGFTLQAAEAVVDTAGWPAGREVMDVVQSLVDKSLLHVKQARASGDGDRPSALGEPHFATYLSIHDYASARLAASGPAARRDAEARHGRHYAALGSDAAMDALFGRDSVRLRQELVAALDNLVVAMRRAAGDGPGEVVICTFRAAVEVLDTRGPIGVAFALAELLPPLDADADALLLSGHLAHARALWRTGQVETAAPLLRRIAAVADGRGDARARGRALYMLGGISTHTGQLVEANEQLQEALVLARSAGDLAGEGWVRSNLGHLHYLQSQFDEAGASYGAALAIVRTLGDRANEAYALGNLANVDVETGRFALARDRYAEALAVARQIGDLRSEGILLTNMGESMLWIRSDDLEGLASRRAEALRLFEAALAIHRQVGNRRFEAGTLGLLGELQLNQGALGPAESHLDAALRLAIESGDRRAEGVVTSQLGMVHARRGDAGEARALLERGIDALRATGNKRKEGQALASLGELLGRQGLLQQARDAFDAGAASLREANGSTELGELLCLRGRMELAQGDPRSAAALLGEAEGLLATAGGAAVDATLPAAVDGLREALARSGRVS